jgi:hypothetical protein
MPNWTRCFALHTRSNISPQKYTKWNCRNTSLHCLNHNQFIPHLIELPDRTLDNVPIDGVPSSKTEAPSQSVQAPHKTTGTHLSCPSHTGKGIVFKTRKKWNCPDKPGRSKFDCTIRRRAGYLSAGGFVGVGRGATAGPGRGVAGGAAPVVVGALDSALKSAASLS